MTTHLDPKNGRRFSAPRVIWRASPRVYHAFLKVAPKLWRSLCGRVERTTAGGPFIDRPDAVLRCGFCDGAEVRIFRAEESLPTMPAGRARRPLISG